MLKTVVKPTKFFGRVRVKILRITHWGIRKKTMLGLKNAESIEERFYCKGVFEALDFAFRNAHVLGIDEDSIEYLEIKRAYWSMPWAYDAHVKHLACSHKQNSEMTTCAKERKANYPCVVCFMY